MSEPSKADLQAVWDRLWLPRLCEAIVLLESGLHPPHCADWDGDGCDCGIYVARSQLLLLVGASDDEGTVKIGHPLQVARVRSSAVAARETPHGETT